MGEIAPDLLLIYGDTPFPALVGLMAMRRGIPCAYVSALFYQHRGPASPPLSSALVPGPGVRDRWRVRMAWTRLLVARGVRDRVGLALGLDFDLPRYLRPFSAGGRGWGAAPSGLLRRADAATARVHPRPKGAWSSRSSRATAATGWASTSTTAGPTRGRSPGTGSTRRARWSTARSGRSSSPTCPPPAGSPSCRPSSTRSRPARTCNWRWPPAATSGRPTSRPRARRDRARSHAAARGPRSRPADDHPLRLQLGAGNRASGRADDRVPARLRSARQCRARRPPRAGIARRRPTGERPTTSAA